MSMLQAQCDELRSMAESVGLAVPQAATLMMGAADAIEGLEAEKDRLRELVRDMNGFIRSMDEDCGDITFSDCFDYCKHDTADDGCCKTGECWYEHRMRELGIEVD